MADESEEPRPDTEEEEGGPVKSFLEHLEDLRWVLIKCGAALVVGMAVCMAGAPILIDILMRPLANSGAPVSVNPMGPLSSVMITMKIMFYGGMVLALPFILYFIADFLLPALKSNEKTYVLRAFVVGAGLFMAGVMLCYFVVLQISLKGMVAYTKWLGLETEIWRAEDYFHFVILFMIGMGISFELPVVVLTLVRLGILQHQQLIKGRKYIFAANLVGCAFISPDVISTIFMVIPVQALMEVCILISSYWERQKRAAEASLTAHGSKQLPSAD